MGYEDAKSTKMLATRCAACGRPLRDATSVEAGMGPVCREKYDYEDALPVTDKVLGRVHAALLGVDDSSLRSKVKVAVNKDDSRRAANVLIHHIAIHQKDPAAMPAIRVIKALGYDALADRIEDRLKPKIEVKKVDDRIIVDSPYSEEYVEAVKRISGRKFDWDDKTWSVPVDKKRELWEALREGFEGELALGPKGPFVL